MDMPTDMRSRRRVAIEAVTPEVNSGRYPIKRVVGERVEVEADIFADGHDHIGARLLWQREGDTAWQETAMIPLINDRWRGSLIVEQEGRYEYTVEGWIDYFLTWRSALEKRVAAGQDLNIELLIGAELVRQTAARAKDDDKKRLEHYGDLLSKGEISDRVTAALDEHLLSLAVRYPDLSHSTHYHRTLSVWVDRSKARFSSWYEMFPRSAATEANRHGTFRDVIARLPYIAELGFDVLYFPPIHPIGTTYRKGANNELVAEPGAPGSPWAIGSEIGGHKAIHPELGRVEDFRALVQAAGGYGIEIALDIALQCSPDHPYVTEHRGWFKERPDGRIQYAENPPKKYQDIYPFDFDCEDWRGLWGEVKSIFDYWIEQGVKVFRVDNPHTKPFRFWEWLIGEIKLAHPEVLFLSEAFTRPKVMHRLSKVGFTQSYTYFTWRNNKWELEQYLNELSLDSGREYFIPNLWPNTPDILHEYLQTGGRPAFITRLILAATTSGNYGIYGAAYELCVNKPKEKDSEEYLNSEKYEIKHFDLSDPDSLRSVISSVNRARKENVALQTNFRIRFHKIDNPFLMFYSRASEDGINIVFVAVNLDPLNTQIGWVDLPIADFGIGWDEPYQVEDYLTGSRYIWRGGRNYIELNPGKMPAHIFKLRRRKVEEGGGEKFE